MARQTTITESRKMAQIQADRASRHPSGASAPPQQDEALHPVIPPFTMPQPTLPLVLFRFTQSDEASYGVVLRRGDRSVDLGVFAVNHTRIQQVDGVRHRDDPDLQRMAEFLKGTWEELPEVASILARIDALEEAVTSAGLASAAEPETEPA